MVAEDLDVPFAYISMVEDDVQWFHSCHGTNFETVDVADSFCAHTISEEMDSLVVLDATKDERFCDLPYVKEEPSIRFYAGASIITNGYKLGSLCAIDTKPHSDIPPEKLKRLETLAKLASSHIALKSDSVDMHKFEMQHEREMRRHRLSLKASNVVSWIWNVVDNTFECDQEMRDMFRIEHNDTIYATDILARIHPDDLPSVQKRIATSINNDEDYESEYRISTTGRWVISQGAILDKDPSGRPLRVAGVNLDITDQKNAEEKTRLLLKELNHRVKNTLAVLQSIATQTLNSASSPEEFKSAFSQRIQGIASAHTLLSDQEWGPVDIHRVVNEQVSVYAFSSETQLEISGDQATLGAEKSLALGMVLHELATNAAKYGALSNAEGKIKIKTSVIKNEDGDQLQILWEENGGPQVDQPDREGFGTVMITRSLDKIIGSSVSLSYDPKGLKAHIIMPL